MAKFHVPNFHLSFENSGFGNLMEAGGILSLLQALTEPGVGERDTTRMDIRYERIMIRNNQNGNFAHSGRARRLSKGIKARTFQLFPVSFLCTAFGSFSLSSSHLSSDTLRGKLKPQTTTLRNSKWILSARPTPPSPPLLPAHAHTRAGLRPRPGVSGRSGNVQPKEWGGYNFSFYLAPVEARGREKD